MELNFLKDPKTELGMDEHEQNNETVRFSNAVKEECSEFYIKHENVDFYDDPKVMERESSNDENEGKGKSVINNEIDENIEASEENKQLKFKIKTECISIDESDKEDIPAYIKNEELILKDEVDDEEWSENGDTDFCSMLVIISDNPVPMGEPDRAEQTIPEAILELRTSPESGSGIFALRPLNKGVQLGPYEGKLTKVDTTDGYSWKLKGRLVDASDETNSNYLRYINCAISVTEQNLAAFQNEGNLYYRTCRDVREGEELLIFFNSTADNFYKPPKEDVEKEFYTCQFCRVGLKFKTDRNKHQQVCRFNTDTAETPGKLDALLKKYTCSYCSYRTNHEGALKRHTNAKHKILKMKCTDCNFETCNNVFSCDDCDFVAYRKCHFSLHRRNKHQLKNTFTCEDCGFVTYCRSYLSRHKFKHEQKNVIKCGKCDYQTFLKSELNIHKKIHGKEFKCMKCDYECSYKGNLNKHILLKHERKKPYSCEICDYQTHNTYYLNSHIVIQHGKRNVIKCKDCNFETYYKYDYNLHRIGKH